MRVVYTQAPEQLHPVGMAEVDHHAHRVDAPGQEIRQPVVVGEPVVPRGERLPDAAGVTGVAETAARPVRDGVNLAAGQCARALYEQGLGGGLRGQKDVIGIVVEQQSPGAPGGLGPQSAQRRQVRGCRRLTPRGAGIAAACCALCRGRLRPRQEQEQRTRNGTEKTFHPIMDLPAPGAQVARVGRHGRFQILWTPVLSRWRTQPCFGLMNSTSA